MTLDEKIRLILAALINKHGPTLNPHQHHALDNALEAFER